MYISRILLCSLVLLIAESQSLTYAADRCPYPENKVLAHTLKFMEEPATIVYDLSGDFATRFVEEFNKLPPPTDLLADRVVVYDHQSASGYHIRFFHSGCMVFEGGIDREKVNNVFKRSLHRGQAA